jgi:hypothetical protein
LHKAAEELGVDLGERFGVIKSSTVEEFAATVSNYAGFRDVDAGRVVAIFRGLEKFVAPLTATAMSLEEVEKSLGFNGEFSGRLRALLKYPGSLRRKHSRHSLRRGVLRLRHHSTC